MTPQQILVIPVDFDVLSLSHEIWAAAQLAPGEGIEDGCARVAAILREQLFADHEVTK